MATDFAVSLRRFLTGHLAELRGYSPNTIASHRDAFTLLICYFRVQRHTPPERLTLEQVDAAAIAVSGLAADHPPQRRVDRQPTTRRDRLVLHLDANPSVRVAPLPANGWSPGDGNGSCPLPLEYPLNTLRPWRCKSA